MAYEMRLVLARYFLAEGFRGGQEAIPKLLCLGAPDAGTNLRTARTDAQSYPDGRGSLGGNPGTLD
jgi:hypothetical protein